MLQNVNLYLPEFRRKQHWLDANRMLQLLAALVAVLVLVSGWEYWQLQRLQSSFAALDAQRQQAVAATAALRARYGVQGEDPALLEDIRQQEESLRSKETLIRFLEGRDMGNTSGFSAYLAELARYHLQGLSLSRVNLGQGGASVVLAGQVLQTELVPQYLQNLSQGQSFASKSFETLQIRDVPADASAGLPPVWNFEVKSLNP